MPADAAPRHPDLEPLAALVGAWEGVGEGDYPTVEAFGYVERTRFWHDGRPFLFYEQRTWVPDRSRSLHAESGLWRAHPDGRVEATIAQTGGITEVAEGRVDGGHVELASTSIGRTASAKQVDGVWRRYRVDGDRLEHELDLAAVGVARTWHLRATLARA